MSRSDLSITLDVARQTPKSSFANAMENAGHAALELIKAAHPMLSAAVSQLTAAAPGPARSLSSGSALSLQSTGGSAPATTGGSEIPSQGSQWDLLKAQQSMNEQSQGFNLQYLQLQESMQKESREFTAVTNIMKVRHDSAKAAINNIH